METFSNTQNITISAATANEIAASAYSVYQVWSPPEMIKAVEYSDRVEFIYKQIKDPHITYAVTWPVPHEQRVFKIVFSCVDGKWNKSEPIYGRIVPAQSIPEYYEFNEEGDD